MSTVFFFENEELFLLNETTWTHIDSQLETVMIHALTPQRHNKQHIPSQANYS